MAQELASPGDEECPTIVSVYSLDNPQVKIEPGTHTVRDELGRPMPPSVFLKEFQPFGDKNATTSIPKISQTTHETIITDSFTYKPRTPNFTAPRPRLDQPTFLRQPFYSPRGVRPTPPHLLISATQQNTTQYPNTNITADYMLSHSYEHIPPPIQPNTQQRPPLPPHQLINSARQGKSLTPPHVRATFPVIQQSYNIDRPSPQQTLSPHEIIKINQFNTRDTFTQLTTPQSADHEHTRSHSYPNVLPISKQVNPGARQHTRTVPLAPHEILQSKTAPTSRSPNEPTASSQEQQIKQQIINYLNTSGSLGKTALKISKGINQPRKLVQEILNRQSLTVFRTNSTQPYIYSTSYNGSSSSSPYSLQKRPLPSSESNLESTNSKRIDTSAKNFNMDPISLLSHLCSRDKIPLEYRMVSSTQKAGKADMVMEVRVGAKSYTARGSNKKNAKKDVSDLALKDLLVHGKFLG